MTMSLSCNATPGVLWAAIGPRTVSSSSAAAMYIRCSEDDVTMSILKSVLGHRQNGENLIR